MERLQDDGNAREGPERRVAIGPTGTARIALRLLATSDLHGWVRDFDYTHGRATGGRGLEAALPVVASLRQENPNTMLFDAGDFLTGSTLGDAAMQGGMAGPNPVIAAMNVMGYDAVGLGNHEFDYGRAALDRALDQADFPVLSTNVVCAAAEDPTGDAPFRNTALLLRRRMRDGAGRMHDVRIGVVSFLPGAMLRPAGANHADVEALHVRDVAAAAAAWIADLRARGADVVVAICHDGPDEGRQDHPGSPPNLAAAGGVDAIVMGHFHDVFPPAARNVAAPVGAEARRGLLNGVPAVMPGCWGRHVGIIDLALDRGADGRWQVSSEGGRTMEVSAPVRRVRAAVLQAEKLREVTSLAHEVCVNRGSRHVATLPADMTSYFARLGRCPVTMLVGRVMARTVLAHMPDRPDLPVIGMAAPSRAGGAGGAEHYAALRAGPLRLSHLDLLAPFPDRICAIEVTGAQLIDWFERTAAGFRQLSAGSGDASLVETRLPGLAFHLSADVHAVIDLGRAAKFDPYGEPMHGGAGRVRSITVQGRPVGSRDRFLLALNDFRAKGGGDFPGCTPQNMRWHSDVSLRQAILAEAAAAISGDLWEPGLTLHAPAGVAPVFCTGAGARAHLGVVEDLAPVHEGGDGAWLNLRLTRVRSGLEIEA